ncbi:MAG: tRNA (guanosine(46)-N7)-methyltransferase TrmB [Gammaproteobacteria bacterium]
MTPGQRAALGGQWRYYGIDPAGVLDLDRIFGRCAPRYLEVGFGMGDTLIQLALAHPQHDYLGIEVYEPGIGHLLGRLAQLGVSNVRAVRGDAHEIFETSLPEQSFDGIFIFFPDPWPKRRHHKRRLVQPQFVSLMSRKLRPRGVCHIVTDVEHYAQHMLDVLGRESTLRNQAGTGEFSQRPVNRPLTKFERRGLAQGRSIWDMIFIRRE